MSGRRYTSLSELDESSPSHGGGSGVGTIGGMDRTPAELDFSDRAEDKATRFKIMLRAVLGELICTTTFLFTALGAVINLKRSYPNDVSLFPIAMSFGLAAVGNIYAFAEVSGAVCSSDLHCYSYPRCWLVAKSSVSVRIGHAVCVCMYV